MVKNIGKISFVADLKLVDRLQSGIIFGGITRTVVVADQRNTKDAVAMIPLGAYIALAMSDFPEITKLTANATIDGQNLLTIAVPNVTLAPNEAVFVEFGVDLKSPS